MVGVAFSSFSSEDVINEADIDRAFKFRTLEAPMDFPTDTLVGDEDFLARTISSPIAENASQYTLNRNDPTETNTTKAIVKIDLAVMFELKTFSILSPQENPVTFFDFISNYGPRCSFEWTTSINGCFEWLCSIPSPRPITDWKIKKFRT